MTWEKELTQKNLPGKDNPKFSRKNNPDVEKKREEVPILVDCKNDLVLFRCPISAMCCSFVFCLPIIW
jgi:hypothetical protein